MHTMFRQPQKSVVTARSLSAPKHVPTCAFWMGLSIEAARDLGRGYLNQEPDHQDV